MKNPLKDNYRKQLWDIYARAVSMISTLVIVVSFVIGGYDLAKLAFPAFTLNSALHEKYQTNESYTEFGKFNKDLPQEAITHERVENYKKLLRMERRNALQRIVKVLLAVFIVAVLNGILVATLRIKYGQCC